jgi:tetratricopeptide (TPR) repeat protein
MRKGEKAILLCSPAYAYGASGSPPKIPANAWLSFEVELIDWEEPLHLMSKERKLERAAQRREAGNAAFKAQNYQEAITQYQASLSVLNAVYGSDSVTADLKAAVHSNVAACELKQNRFNEARKACDEALKLQPTHTKAMFRRGVALMELGEMDQAKSDLASALQLASDAKLDAEVAAIKKEQARLKLKIQAEKEKEKQLFGGWLNK